MILRSFFFAFIFLTAGKVIAQPAGPSNSTNISDGGGGQIAEAWANPNLARTQNNLYATIVTADKNKRTNYLQAQNFGFAIPAGSSIDGIVVEIDRYVTAVGGGAADDRIRIIDATGTIVAGSDRSTGLSWPSLDADTYQSYGGSTDTWSVTDWTASKINNNNFGVAIQASTSNDNTTFNLFVDHIRITVYYTSGGSQRYAVASSTWNNANTWASTPGGTPGAGVPTTVSDVFIGGGFTVTQDVAGAVCNSLTIGTTEAIPNGALTFNNNNRDIDIGFGGFVITGNGDILSTFSPTLTTAGDLTLNKVLTNRVFEITMNGTTGLVISGTGSLGILNVQSSTTNTGTLSITDQLKGNNNALVNGAPGYIIFSGSNSKLINLTTVGNTIEFSHAIPAGTYDITNTSTSYYNLVFSGDAIKRYNSNIIVNNNLTITGTGVVSNLSSRDITLYGNWTNNNGAAGFVPNTGNVILIGGGTQTIANAAGQTFYRLQVNKAIATSAIAANNIAVTNRLTMTDGIFDMGSNSLSGAGTTIFDGGELILGATGLTVPQMTGAYTINAGTYTFNGAGAQTIRSTASTPALSAYANVQFAGSGTKSLSGAIVVNNNLTIGGTTTLDVTPSNFSISLKGNWSNASTFNPRSGTVTLNGTAAQTVTNPAGENFYNLTLNNTTTSNAITLGGPASVSNALTFTAGHLVTTAANLITLGASATVASVSNTSHVKGPVAKVKNTTTAFVFPVGTGTIYQPVSVTPTSTTSTTYVATYFASEQPLGATLGAGIDHISPQDYWTVERTSGTANAAVTLSWNYAGTPEINNLADLRVAQWNGTQWTDQGNAGTTGTFSTGTVKSNAITSFVQPYFVIASSTTNNPLSANRYFVAATGNWDGAGVWAYTSGGPATAPTPTSTKNVFIESGNTVTILDATAGQAAVSMLSLNIFGTITMSNSAGRDVVMTVGAGGLTVGPSGNVTGADTDFITVGGNITLNNTVNLSHTLLEVNFSSQSNTISGTGLLPFLNVNNNNQVFTGSTAYTKLAVPNTATNNGTITVNGTLSGGGGRLTNASTGTVIWQGTSLTNKVINATAVGNTVQLINNSGGSIDLDDAVSATTYYHLILGGSNDIINSNDVIINGNLTIDTGAVFDNADKNKKVNIGGNWINNNGAGGFLHGNDIITFDGSLPQTIYTSSGIEVFNTLAMNNSSSAGLTISQGEVHVTNDLTLTDGNIYTTATNLLVVEDNATSDPGSAASFVDGPIKKVGNDVFVFPVGNGSTWARLKMESLANFDVTTEFTCQYLHAAYSNTIDLDTDVSYASHVEHWLLSRVIDPGDNASCNVRLYWESASASQIEVLSDLRVGHFYNSGSGDKWHNFGGTPVDNGNGSGEIVSTMLFTSFSPITFISEYGFALPVELTSFTAKVRDDEVVLNWSTASELNNDYFEIERFENLENISTLGKVQGHGSTNEPNRYEFVDSSPLHGRAYYRLKQVDFDGTTQYSRIVTIAYSIDAVTDPVIFPNPGDGAILNFFTGSYRGAIHLNIFTQQGVFIESTSVDASGDNGPFSVLINSHLKPGVYLIGFDFGTRRVIKKWIVE